jgi:hypothetical protein
MNNNANPNHTKRRMSTNGKGKKGERTQDENIFFTSTSLVSELVLFIFYTFLYPF